MAQWSGAPNHRRLLPSHRRWIVQPSLYSRLCLPLPPHSPHPSFECMAFFHNVSPTTTELHALVPRHVMARPEFLKMHGPLAPPLGPAPPPFPHRAAQPTHKSTAPLIPSTSHAYPRPPISAGSPTSNSVDISDPSIAFTTPPTKRRVFFGTSPQSPAQKSHSAAFGI